MAAPAVKPSEPRPVWTDRDNWIAALYFLIVAIILVALAVLAADHRRHRLALTGVNATDRHR